MLNTYTKQEVVKLLRGALQLLEDVLEDVQEPKPPKFKPGDIIRLGADSLWGEGIAKVKKEVEGIVCFDVEGKNYPKCTSVPKNLTLLIPAEPQELDGIRVGDVVETDTGTVGKVIIILPTPQYMYPYPFGLLTQRESGLVWCSRKQIKRVITFGAT